MILDEIIQNKISEVAQRKKELSIEKIKTTLSLSERNFKAALSKGHGLNLIAEVKRKSPSKGVIRDDVDIFEVVQTYTNNQFVSAISFLTDYKYFGGTVEEMLQISLQTTKPVIRKDFIIDEYQIFEARYFGADAILLIASVLTTEQMQHYIEIAKSLKMDCLVEVHNENEVKKLPTNVEIAGVNNRNLKDFTISLETTKKVYKKLRTKAEIIVTESGIYTSEDVKIVKDFADAMLVGTSIMKENDLSSQIDSLFRPDIKICGITQLKDAIYCASIKVNYLGFIFYMKSKRYINPNDASTIIAQVKDQFPDVKFVGVFVNETKNQVLEIMKKCQLDLVQLHGEEDKNYFADVADKTIKAFRVENQINQFQIDHINQCKAKYLLLDTYSKNAYGGTGKSFNWNNIKAITHNNLFVAGGINQNNFKEALKYKPDVLDINSGVEISPGIKDHDKIEKILRGLK